MTINHYWRLFEISKLTRPSGTRRYRSRFIIACEGSVTEIDYFNIVQSYLPREVVSLKTIKGGKDPLKVLERLKAVLKGENFMAVDQAWIVVDVDRWTQEQLQQLHKWSQTTSNYGLAVSNPQFEFWLLLHFELGEGVRTISTCEDRLKRYIPNYNKHIPNGRISSEMITAAVENGRLRDIPPCEGWPTTFGRTTVYKLVHQITTTASST